MMVSFVGWRVSRKKSWHRLVKSIKTGMLQGDDGDDDGCCGKTTGSYACEEGRGRTSDVRNDEKNMMKQMGEGRLPKSVWRWQKMGAPEEALEKMKAAMGRENGEEKARMRRWERCRETRGLEMGWRNARR